jgi:hypothetical protein
VQNRASNEGSSRQLLFITAEAKMGWGSPSSVRHVEGNVRGV